MGASPASSTPIPAQILSHNTTQTGLKPGCEQTPAKHILFALIILIIIDIVLNHFWKEK